MLPLVDTVKDRLEESFVPLCQVRVTAEPQPPADTLVILLYTPLYPPKISIQ